MGQLYFPVRIAMSYGIKLIMYGDAQAEKAGDENLLERRFKFAARNIYL